MPDRRWALRAVGHEATFLDSHENDGAAIRGLVEDATLVVVNAYSEPRAYSLLRRRVATGRPWCFWGERPGVRLPNLAGRLVRQWTLRRLHRSGAPIWGIGKYALGGYRAEFGGRRSYWNLPYFSELERFRRLGAERPAPRAERGMVCSGALILRKGVDLLARAFVEVARKQPLLRLCVLGDGKMRRSMERVLISVRQQVEFLGFRDWAELPQIYAQADVLCVPSRYDGWGLVVPEGLAAGLPVIATDRMGAALEFVVDKYNGWLVPAGSYEALADALDRAAALSTATLAAMSAAACETVREHTLANGAQRFIAAARDAMTHWSA